MRWVTDDMESGCWCMRSRRHLPCPCYLQEAPDLEMQTIDLTQSIPRNNTYIHSPHLLTINYVFLYCRCSFHFWLCRNPHAQAQKWFTTNSKSSSSAIQISQSSATSTFSTVLPVCRKQMPAMFGWVAWQLWQKIQAQPQRRHLCCWKRDTSRTRKMGKWSSIGRDENSSKNWRSQRKRLPSRLASQLTARHQELCSRQRSRSMAISGRLMTPSLQVIGYLIQKAIFLAFTSVLQLGRGWWWILLMIYRWRVI